MVITPTMTYASGAWTLSQTHERMIKTAQRRMLRLIVQTKRRYNTKREKETKMKSAKGVDNPKESDCLCATDEETAEGSEQSSNCDQDSDVSCHEDEDEEIDKCEKEEDWIEFIKWST